MLSFYILRKNKQHSPLDRKVVLILSLIYAYYEVITEINSTPFTNPNGNYYLCIIFSSFI